MGRLQPKLKFPISQENIKQYEFGGFAELWTQNHIGFTCLSNETFLDLFTPKIKSMAANGSYNGS